VKQWEAKRILEAIFLHLFLVQKLRMGSFLNRRLSILKVEGRGKEVYSSYVRYQLPQLVRVSQMFWIIYKDMFLFCLWWLGRKSF